MNGEGREIEGYGDQDIWISGYAFPALYHGRFRPEGESSNLSVRLSRDFKNGASGNF